MATTPEQHFRYNRSAKGQARNQRYEAKHPERKDRNRTGFIARDAYGRDTQGTQEEQE